MARLQRRERLPRDVGNLLALLILFCSAVVFADEQQTALNRHLQQAQIHLEKEEYPLVVEELRKAIEIHPQIPGAYYQLGLSHWHLGEMAEAEQAFQKELEFEPPDAYSLYYLGRIRLSEGKTDEAIAYFERVLQIGTLLDVRSRLAGAYLSTDQVEKAVALLEDSVRRNPEQGEVHYLLGRAYQRQGRVNDARREFELAKKWKNKLQHEIRGLVELRVLLKGNELPEALALARQLGASGDPEVMLSTAIALGQSGQHREALPVLERVIELQPASAEAYYNMALARVSLEQPSEAAPLLAKAVELRPELYEARMLLGNLLVQAGQNEQAISHLRAAAKIRPENAKLLAFLGLQYLQERYYEEAVKTLRQAVELQPDEPDLRFLLVEAHYKNHDFERALAEARQTVAKFPELPASHYQVAWQLDNMGNFPEAKGFLEKAVGIDAGFVEARRLLGEVLLKLGDAEGSLEHFRRAIANNPKLVEAYAGLGKALIQLKRYEEAEQEMKKAIGRDAELAPLHLYLSQAYRSLGRMDEAKQEAATFTRLNRERAEKRDQDVERTYVPE